MKMIIIVPAVVLLTACGDSTGPNVRLSIPSDDWAAQSGIMGQAVSTAPTVLVTDGRNKPLAGVTVSFAITKGGGTVSSSTQTTGVTGRASVQWTLGRRFGENELAATVSGLEPVTFSAMAMAPDSGIVVFNLIDPAADTLRQDDTSHPKAVDLLSLRGEFKRDALVLTATFAAPVSPQFGAPNFLDAYFEFDIDDDATTGGPGLSLFFGVPSATGIDYALNVWGADAAVSNRLPNQLPNPVPVIVTFSGNTVVLSVPMELLGNDDGNFSIAGVIGVFDRANDINWATDTFPNSGQLVARPSFGARSNN